MPWLKSRQSRWKKLKYQTVWLQKSSKKIKKCHILTIFPVLGKLTHMGLKKWERLVGVPKWNIGQILLLSFLHGYSQKKIFNNEVKLLHCNSIADIIPQSVWSLPFDRGQWFWASLLGLFNQGIVEIVSLCVFTFAQILLSQIVRTECFWYVSVLIYGAKYFMKLGGDKLYPSS